MKMKKPFATWRAAFFMWKGWETDRQWSNVSDFFAKLVNFGACFENRTWNMWFVDRRESSLLFGPVSSINECSGYGAISYLPGHDLAT